MDEKYTDFIRESVENEGSFYASIWTEAEVDRLLDAGFSGGNDINPHYPTLMVEEAFFRQTGIKVDLHTAGAASLAVGKSTRESAVGQTHALITIRDQQSVLRSAPSENALVCTSFTPEDVNMPVKSLDFAPRKVAPTPLDRISIDEKESPIEKAFINALTAVQALDILGADVTDLVDWLSVYWNIPYIGRLMNEVGFANIDDLGSFIASGGRPSPAIYMSNNVTSRFRPINVPRVDTDALGHASAFMGRYVAIAKFITITTNLIQGAGSHPEMTFQANDSHLSALRTTSLVGKKYRCNSIAMQGKLVLQITQKETFEEFTAARIASAAIVRNDRLSLFKNTSKIISRLPKLDIYSSTKKSQWILADRGDMPMQMGRPVVLNFHSKIATMLFAYTSVANKAAIALDTFSICISILILAWCDLKGDVQAEAISRLDTMPGFSRLRRAINIGEARQSIKELDDLCKDKDPTAITYYYLLYRYFSLTAPKFGQSLEKAKDKNFTIGSMHYQGDHRRGLKVSVDWLAGKDNSNMSVRPFSYLKQSTGAMNQTEYSLSLLTEELRDQLDSNIKANPMKITAEKLLGPVFVRMRESWHRFYLTKASVMTSVRLFIEKFKDSIEEEVYNCVVDLIQTEEAYYYASSMAYRYYSISINGMANMEGTTLSIYIKMLQELGSGGVNSKIDIDDKSHYFAQKKSALSVDAWHHVTEPRVRDKLIYYYGSGPVRANVRRSVMELINADADLVRDSVGSMLPMMTEPVKVDANNSELELVDIRSALMATERKAKAVVPDWVRTMCGNASVVAGMLDDYPILRSIFRDIADVLPNRYEMFENGKAKELCMRVGRSVQTCSRLTEGDDVQSYVDKTMMDDLVMFRERLFQDVGMNSVFS